MFFPIVTTPYSVNISIQNGQTVGRQMILECIVTTMRGITSTMDIVWRSNNSVIAKYDAVNISSSQSNFAVYSVTYMVSQLHTADDGRVYQCEVVINTSPPVMATGSVILDVTVPTPTVSITPSGPIQGAMVGSPQDIQCTVSTVSGVELNSVMISWMGPGGDTIRNGSRVTISPTSGSGNNYTSSLQFMYLMEGDEGTYECNVLILETIGSEFVMIKDIGGMYVYTMMVFNLRDANL